jgi:hypothetical protein
MERRLASINDLPIRESDRKYLWPLGRCPDNHPGLSERSSAPLNLLRELGRQDVDVLDNRRLGQQLRSLGHQRCRDLAR